jgi:cyclic 2,3-diphosphoglycerate synthase
MTRILVLVDGEHHPDVVEATVASLAAGNGEVVAAVYLGGGEKLTRSLNVGVPVYCSQPEDALREAIRRTAADTVVELTDEPVVDPVMRLRLAGIAVAAGLDYVGGGYRLDALRRPRLTRRPTLAVIGTGKRTGKTAVAIEIARTWRRWGLEPCVVTMGRGGPATPIVIGAGLECSTDYLLELRARGLHAASDYVEDAVFSGCATVGTRRIGAGLTGVTFHDNFADGVALAEGLHPDVILLEGSGTAIPPAAADATVLVTSDALPSEFVAGYLGPMRIELADAVVVVGAGTRAHQMRSLIHGVRPDVPVMTAALEPESTVPVAGRSVFVATTAPDPIAPVIEQALLGAGADRAIVSTSLADRDRLAAALAALDGVDLVLTELKAAAVDVVVGHAEALGIEVGLLHNRPVVDGGVERLAGLVVERQDTTR